MNVLVGEISVLFINHMSHFSGINEKCFPFLLFILADKPEGDGNGHAIKKLCRQSYNSLHKVSLNDAFSDFPLTAGLSGQRTICKNKTYLAVGGEVVDHMLNPRIVGVTGRGRTKLPTHIVLQLFLSPVGEIKRRICHNEICFQRGVEVIKESVCLIRSEVGVDTTDRHIHLRHFPSIGV